MNYGQFIPSSNNNSAFNFDGVDTITQTPATGIVLFDRVVNDMSSQNETTEQPNKTIATVADTVTNEKVTETTQTTSKNVVIDDGAANTFGTDLDKDSLSVNANGSNLFAVDKTGKILTNQMIAPGVHVTVSYEIPIYNEAGTIKGYIPVRN